jgi:hypothetical protein
VLRELVRQLGVRMRITVWVTSFDAPPYEITADKRLPAGFHSLREFVRVEHAQHTHIIDNKLMDGVSR